MLEDTIRFWEKITKNENGCWIYTTRTYTNNYGQFYYRNDEGKQVKIDAHVYMWKIVLRRSKPRKHDIHHTCENKRCVNPDHLDLLSKAQHAKVHSGVDPTPDTQCGRGHELTPENSYTSKTPWGVRIRCKLCAKAKATEQRSRIKQVRDADPEKDREYREKERAYHSVWREVNREKSNGYTAAYRERLKLKLKHSSS